MRDREYDDLADCLMVLLTGGATPGNVTGDHRGAAGKAKLDQMVQKVKYAFGFDVGKYSQHGKL